MVADRPRMPLFTDVFYYFVLHPSISSSSFYTHCCAPTFAYCFPLHLPHFLLVYFHCDWDAVSGSWPLLTAGLQLSWKMDRSCPSDPVNRELKMTNSLHYDWISPQIIGPKHIRTVCRGRVLLPPKNVDIIIMTIVIFVPPVKLFVVRCWSNLLQRPFTYVRTVWGSYFI